MKYMNLAVIIFSLFLSGCSEKIIDGSKMSKDTIKNIQKLGILDKDEQILFYYTSFNNKVSGNFITKKRVASYWQYDKAPKDNYINSAYYNEIRSVNVKYGDGFEFTSALIIELKNGKKFKVYFNGSNDQIDKIYKEVIKLWKKE